MPGGRPSKVTAELLERASNYINVYTDLGEVIPTVEGLACYVDLSTDTLYERKEFSDNLIQIKRLQGKELINKGLEGKFNSTIAKMLLNSKHGVIEKTNTDLTSGGEKVSFVNTVPRSASQSTEL